MATELYQVDGRTLRLRLHPGQRRAWHSPARFTFIVAGTQSGKTSLAPWLLHREIARTGAGDYLAVTASYDLFKLKLLPEFLCVFCDILRWGRYLAGERVIISHDGKTRIILRSASAPGGLESATARAAVLDECGQPDFQLGAWEAVQRRLSLHQGRAIGLTTPYNLGWLKTQVYDRFTAGDAAYNVIQFDSTLNPAFPQAEYERAKATLPDWKFQMFYRGQFSRPAGLIYDCLSDAAIAADFTIPQNWPRFLGLDFGAVNTCALWFALDPETTTLYAFSEYLAGGRTAAGHAAELRRVGNPARAWGGAGSEQNWRDEFTAAGLPVARPQCADVELGITRVYGGIKTGRVRFFRDGTRHTIDQLRTYSRKLDRDYNPTSEIDNKAAYHYLDAARYVLSELLAPDSGRVMMGRPRL